MRDATNYSGVASGNRRGTSDKTGQNTRARLRVWALFLYGPVCQFCLEPIDLTLKSPHPRAYSTDHKTPRVAGGGHLFCNVRPAHSKCNSVHGGKTRGHK